jgi:phosphotriesterase-related protein
MKNFGFLFLAFLLGFISCKKETPRIITVAGAIAPEMMGKTLEHEHLLVDFISADSVNYSRWNRDEAVRKLLPYLLEIKAAGYKTLVDATPAFMGRDPQLLKMLSEKSGIQILTNTGLYTAGEGVHLPRYAFLDSAVQIAGSWIYEYKNSIEKSGVYPGFIKIAVERRALGDVQRRIVEAACITHQATGLTIMSHTGLAVPAFEQLAILKKFKIHPSAFIWAHANNEKDYAKQIEAAKMGAWISFDKFTPGDTAEYVSFAKQLKAEGLLNKLMFSHDAGWFDPEKPGGGTIRGYMDIENFLIPALKNNGFTEEDIDRIFVKNPAEAFQVRVRTIE